MQAVPDTDHTLIEKLGVTGVRPPIFDIQGSISVYDPPFRLTPTQARARCKILIVCMVGAPLSVVLCCFVYYTCSNIL